MKKNNFIKNRKADMTIVIFVMLVLVVSSSALFMFITNSGKVEAKISDVMFMESFYSEEEVLEFYLETVGEQAFLKTYDEIAESNYYAETRVYNSEGKVRFGELNKELNEEFENYFSQNFEKSTSNPDFEEVNLNKLQDTISEGDFDAEFNEGILIFSVSSLKLGKEFNEINASYSPKFILEFDLEEIGLHSFEEIYSVKEKCKGEENIQTCFEQIGNFNIEIGESSGDVLVKLKSKKDFLIDGEFKSINIEFVVK